MTKSGIHLVAGSGTVGSSLALILAESGIDVVVATRSGSGPKHPKIKLLSINMNDFSMLYKAVPNAVAVYNCINPPYHRWAQEWPAMAQTFLSYAENTGAVLVTCSNLYGYGPVHVPMVESLPLVATFANGKIRAQMWIDAKAMNDAGRIRATEVRGSDYIAANEQSRLGWRVIPKVLKGKSVQLLGDVNQKHSWTAPIDVARLMMALATDSRAWGKAWHVPSNPPRTQREAIDDLAKAAGVPSVKVSTVPKLILGLLGIFNPMFRALRETEYQMGRPFIIDDTATRQTFGLAPTPWKEILTQTLTTYKKQLVE